MWRGEGGREPPPLPGRPRIASDASRAAARMLRERDVLDGRSSSTRGTPQRPLWLGADEVGAILSD